jgi:hypothetical protein
MVSIYPLVLRLSTVLVVVVLLKSLENIFLELVALRHEFENLFGCFVYFRLVSIGSSIFFQFLYLLLVHSCCLAVVLLVQSIRQLEGLRFCDFL